MQNSPRKTQSSAEEHQIAGRVYRLTNQRHFDLLKLLRASPRPPRFCQRAKKAGVPEGTPAGRRLSNESKYRQLERRHKVEDEALLIILRPVVVGLERAG